MKHSGIAWESGVVSIYTEVSLLQPKFSMARLLALMILPTLIRGVSAATEHSVSSPLGFDLTLNNDLLISLLTGWPPVTLSRRLWWTPSLSSSSSFLLRLSMVASSVAGSSMKSLFPRQQERQQASAQKYFLNRNMTRVRHIATTNIIGPWGRKYFIRTDFDYCLVHHYLDQGENLSNIIQSANV